MAAAEACLAVAIVSLTVEQFAIVRDEEERGLVTVQTILEPQDGREIQMIRRLGGSQKDRAARQWQADVSFRLAGP